MSGDKIVGILAIVMAAAILSRGSRLRALPMQRKLLYAGAWIVIFVGGAWLFGRLLS
jgi:hypothetical protein